MSTAETATHEVVAFAVNAQGPDGTRCRGGHKFWPKDHANAPESYLVTETQLKQIKGDPVINLVSSKKIKPDKEAKEK